MHPCLKSVKNDARCAPSRTNYDSCLKCVQKSVSKKCLKSSPSLKKCLKHDSPVSKTCPKPHSHFLDTHSSLSLKMQVVSRILYLKPRVYKVPNKYAISTQSVEQVHKRCTASLQEGLQQVYNKST